MSGVLYDYTNDDGGHWYAPEDPHLTGIAILDDDQSILNVHPVLGDQLNPRNQGIIKRQSFAVGANRKEGFAMQGGPFAPNDDQKEGFEARENFMSQPSGQPCAASDQQMRDRYVRGDFYPAEYKIKSSRRNWYELENSNWNPRPPHFVADAPNEYSHVVLKQSERGEPTAYPDSKRMVYDRFTGSGPGSFVHTGTIKMVLFFILILVICMTASYNIGYSIGKSVGHFDSEIHHPARA
jgi:hypothetical protein